MHILTDIIDALCGQGDGRHAMGIEKLCHVIGMSNANAEAEAFYIRHVGNISFHTLQNERASLYVRRIDLFQFARIIPAADPFAFTVIHIVCHPEVLECA